MPLTNEIINNYIDKIKELFNTNINEEDTRGTLIDPLLRDLGWDIFNVNEVSRNAKTSSGKFVDYALKTGEEKIYVEAKSLGDKLTKKYQIQATSYAYEDNVPFCILSDGDRYQIFETFKQGSVADRLLIDISLSDEEVSTQRNFFHTL